MGRPYYARQCMWELVTADGIVCPTGAIVYSLSIFSDGVGEADATVYDGQAAIGRKYIPLYAVDEAMAQLRFEPGIIFDKGLFVDIGTNCQGVLVHYADIWSD